jgi:hypothetical protein
MTVKPKFSDRIGVTQTRPIQLKGMNRKLKNSIWNLLLRTIFYGHPEEQLERVSYVTQFFLKLPTDEVPPYEYLAQPWLKTKYFNLLRWWEIYNLLEFMAHHEKQTLGIYNSTQFIILVNSILEGDGSGYRFIGNYLAPITNKSEIDSITEAIEASNAYNLYGAVKHLNTAIELFSKKPKPDYCNSIKESISAIESLVKQLTGEDSGGLDKALSILDSKVKFHGAFKSGLLSLYGYTSDEDGIRHAILEEKDVGFDEAKFMLVACSALVYFIIAKADKHGLLSSS